MSDKQVLRYQVKPLPNKHLFQVCLHVQASKQDRVLKLPTWIPGSYMVRDFAKNLSAVIATYQDKSFRLEKIDKTSWVLPPSEHEVILSYEVFALDMSVRSAHLDNTHGFFNGSSLFLLPDGEENTPCELQIVPPDEPELSDWKLVTSMTQSTGAAHSFGCFTADNYDELIDHPVEMGNFTAYEFEACGISHEVIITGRHEVNSERLCADLKKVCEYQLNYFGKPYPMQRYVFLVQVLASGYGGLEHRNSTALHCSREDLPKLSDAPDLIRPAYRNFLTLCSHEYFHTWNIKRIKPAVYLPYNLSKESHTIQMWIFEGFTRYFESLMLVRSGVITKDDYLQELAELITQLQRTPGRLEQSVAESSFDAWTKFYKQDQNAPNAIISYYTKGGVIALLLDILLRSESAGRLSLDTVMHKLWADFGSQAVGLEEKQLDKILAEFNLPVVTQFIQDAVYGVSELPIAEILNKAGIDCHFRPRVNQADRGGINGAAKAGQADFKIRATKRPDGLVVNWVFADGPAEAAGITPGDVIVAIDNCKIRENWEALIAELPVGESVPVHLFRDDQLMIVSVQPIDKSRDTCVLAFREMTDNQELKLYADWLASR